MWTGAFRLLDYAFFGNRRVLRIFSPLIQKSILCVAFMIGAQTSRLHAQSPPLLWTTNIGARVFAVDEFTNVYANTNGTVIKLNSSGVPLQTNSLSPYPGVVQRDAVGNYYVAAWVPGTYNGSWFDYPTGACFVAKFDSLGGLVWSNRFGPTSLRWLTLGDIQFDSDGNTYVGFEWNLSTQDFSTQIAKFDSSGAKVWLSTVPHAAVLSASGAIRISPMSNTNCYAVTYASSPLQNWSVFLSRFTSDGVSTLITNWPEPFYLTPPPVRDSTGNFFIMEGTGLTKRDTTGTILWQRSAIGQWSVGPDLYEGVHVANGTNLLRYDSDGNPVWTMGLSAACQELLVDGAGNRFASLAGGAVARIGAESLSIPAITNAPASQTVLSGSNVVFTVGVTGTTPLRYFWMRTNTLVSTNATLSLTSVSPTQSGAYYVVITNLMGSVTSAPALLRVKSVELFNGVQLLTNGTYTFPTNPVLTIRSAFTNGSAFYTLNGSTPSFASTFYSGPFTLSHSATVRSIGYSADFSQSEEADVVNVVVLENHRLTASTGGGGTVNLSPSGGIYLSTNVVTVTATPNSGWSFLYWLGDATGTNPVINVSMERDKIVWAVFGTTLSTTVAGNGQILLDPPGGQYRYGKTVQLTAVPQPGNYFGFWGNAATGSTNPLYFTVTNSTPTVSSIFGTVNGGQAALTILITGHGRVIANPQANVYTTGQSVSLTATADSGQSFLNWSGDASGSQNPLSVVMTTSKVITANFSTNAMGRINPQMADGLSSAGFRFTLVSDADSIYEIFASTNLSSWESLGRVTNAFGEMQITDSMATNSPQRFYKIAP